MANNLWIQFISYVTQFLLGDPRFRYAPSSIAKVLDKRFDSMTHDGYLLPGATLGKLIFTGQQSLIFYPVADCKTLSTQELSISHLFEKCHQEFIQEFFLKSKNYDYLIFPIALQKRQHWATLVYDVKSKNILLVDSSTSLVSSYDNQSRLISELRDVFSRYELSIESFHYVAQGLQKDNVHCGAWTLANIIAIDSFGLSNYIEKIENFYHDYLDPSGILNHQTEKKEQELEDDYVFVEHADTDELFEEISQLNSTECIEEIQFAISVEKLMPSTASIEKWEKAILAKLALQIQNEHLVLHSLMLRDNVQYQQHALAKYTPEQLNLSELIKDLETRQKFYKIKDPGRQKQRFCTLGFNDWINKQSIASQVIFEALIHDACSHEPMVLQLFSKCHWLNQLGMLESYLEKIKAIENYISLKAIDLLIQAEQEKRFVWIKEKTCSVDEDLLAWFPKLLLHKADVFIGSKLLLEMVDDIIQRFDESVVHRSTSFAI